MLRHCYRPARRPQVKADIQTLLNECRQEHTEMFMSVSNTPPVNAASKHWIRYAISVRKLLNKFNQTMHVRERCSWKLMNMKKYKQQREEQRKKSQNRTGNTSPPPRLRDFYKEAQAVKNNKVYYPAKQPHRSGRAWLLVRLEKCRFLFANSFQEFEFGMLFVV